MERRAGGITLYGMGFSSGVTYDYATDLYEFFMHDKDRRKIIEAGFFLYRCSEGEKIIKIRKAVDSGWRIHAKCRTKKEVREVSQALLTNPDAIQD